MYYAPHTLQVLIVTPMKRDEYGRPVAESGGEVWQSVGMCRCDDVSAERIIGENGARYDFKYKVVFPATITTVIEGKHVRCLNADGTVRGEGVVKSPLRANYLPYRVVWLE